MMATEVQDGTDELAEHLQLLRSLACELEHAMSAISRNDIGELEDSILQQQNLSAQLVELTDGINAQPSVNSVPAAPDQDRLVGEIRSASVTLQALNQRYAALLQHSSRSVAMMVSLFCSFQGQFQEGSGARLKQQTWSCRA
jgi:hypothetical protein